MLGYFVNLHASNNLLTPAFVLVLFIVSVLALAWAIFTLFSYHRSSSNARFVAFIDLLFVGAFIAGAYELAFISNANCTSFQTTDGWDFYFGDFGSAHVSGFTITADQTCAMLKASFAFGIMNCIFFFFTSVLAWFHGDHFEKRYYKETRRYRSSSRRPHHRTTSHHGSRRSSHSHHSRVYV